MKRYSFLLIIPLLSFGQKNLDDLYPQIPIDALSIDTVFYKSGEIKSIYYYEDEDNERYDMFEYFKHGTLKYWCRHLYGWDSLEKYFYSYGWPSQKYSHQIPYAKIKTDIDNDGGYSNWTNYYENGSIKSKGGDNVNEWCSWEFFYENGKLKSSGVIQGNTNYEGSLGMKTGVWKYYNKEGEKIKDIDYGNYIDVMVFSNRKEDYSYTNYYNGKFDIESLTPNKDYELIELFNWADNLGENLLLVFKIDGKRKHYDMWEHEYDDEIINYTKKIHVFHYLIDEKSNKKLIWDLKDYSDWDVDYIDTSISDWDGDGIAETSVIYFLEKIDGVNDTFDTDLKLILHEHHNKFAIRGNCNGEFMSTCYCNYNMYGKDSFKEAPNQFKINSEMLLYLKLNSSLDCSYNCWDKRTLQKINCDYPD